MYLFTTPLPTADSEKHLSRDPINRLTSCIDRFLFPESRVFSLWSRRSKKALLRSDSRAVSESTGKMDLNFSLVSAKKDQTAEPWLFILSWWLKQSERVVWRLPGNPKLILSPCQTAISTIDFCNLFFNNVQIRKLSLYLLSIVFVRIKFIFIPGSSKSPYIRF